MVLFDKATYDKLLCEAPTYKLITPSILSDLEDKADAISHMDAIVHSTKGNPSVAQIVEGREPEQFFSITQKLIILKGGMSIRYKRSTAEKGRRKFTPAESSSTSTSSISFIQYSPNETLQIGRLISAQSWTFQEIWLPNSTGQS